MNTYVLFWLFLAHFFLKWKILQIKVGHKIKTNIPWSLTFFPRKSCLLLSNVEKYNTTSQATIGDTIQPMHIACCVSMATDTHSEHVILIAFSRQQWLRERASMLRLYLNCLSLVTVKTKSRTPQSFQQSGNCCILSFGWFPGVEHDLWRWNRQSVPKRRHINLDAGVSPKRKNKTFTTRRKYEIKNNPETIYVHT
jgi:hypothetical protein